VPPVEHEAGEPPPFVWRQSRPRQGGRCPSRTREEGSGVDNRKFAGRASEISRARRAILDAADVPACAEESIVDRLARANVDRAAVHVKRDAAKGHRRIRAGRAGANRCSESPTPAPESNAEIPRSSIWIRPEARSSMSKEPDSVPVAWPVPSMSSPGRAKCNRKNMPGHPARWRVEREEPPRKRV
jgi:hypothetical protein